MQHAPWILMQCHQCYSTITKPFGRLLSCSLLRLKSAMDQSLGICSNTSCTSNSVTGKLYTQLYSRKKLRTSEK